VFLSLLLPASSEAWRGGYYGGGYYHGGGYGYGWWGPAFLGGVALGAAVAGPWWYPPPRPVYVYPSPAYVYPTPPAYVYPEPRVEVYPSAPPPQPRPQYQSEGPSGEWVMVPGQWVEGRWVPTHKAWAPRNP